MRLPEEVDQLPSWAMEPLRKTFSPKEVLAISLKVSATAVGVAQVDVVVVLVVVVGLVPVGKDVEVTEE